MPKPKPHGRIHETSHRVRYAETDAMGIAHHSSYVLWFEVGRVQFLRDVGLPYSMIEAMGYIFMITELGVRYRRPARFDEVIIIRTWVAQVGSRGMRLDYEIVGEAQQTLVTGFTKFICADAEGRPTRLPPELVALLQADLPGGKPDAGD